MTNPYVETVDPWRETTLSSDFHFRNSTDSQPIAISNGYHCTDLRIADTAIEDQSVINVQALGVAYIVHHPSSLYTLTDADAPLNRPNGFKNGKLPTLGRSLREP